VRKLYMLLHREHICHLQHCTINGVPMQPDCCLLHRSTTCRNASQRCAHLHSVSCCAIAQDAQAASADAH
jgi:hypothetical protein